MSENGGPPERGSAPDLPDFKLIDPDPATETPRWLDGTHVLRTYTFQIQGGILYPVLSLVRLINDNTYNTCMIPLERLKELAVKWGYTEAQVDILLQVTPIVTNAEYVRRNVLNGTLAKETFVDAGMKVAGPWLAGGINRLNRVFKAATSSNEPEPKPEIRRPEKAKKIRRDVGPIRSN